MKNTAITIAVWIAAIATVVFKRLLLPAGQLVVTIFSDALGVETAALPKPAATTTANAKPDCTPVLAAKA